MILELSTTQLHKLVVKQVGNLFFINSNERILLNSILPRVLQRIEKCFVETPNKYYHKYNQTYFNPYHSGQYNIFLYYLSNSIFKEYNDSILAHKIYYLNKIFNACDIFYEVELPEVFMLDHPVGAVIGRAKYRNYFNFYHGCTVGGNNDLYPILGEKVTMMSDSKIVGKSVIGNNVIIAANTYIKDEKIPNNQIVFGASPNLILKENKFKI